MAVSRVPCSHKHLRSGVCLTKASLLGLVSSPQWRATCGCWLLLTVQIQMLFWAGVSFLLKHFSYYGRQLGTVCKSQLKGVWYYLLFLTVALNVGKKKSTDSNLYACLLLMVGIRAVTPYPSGPIFQSIYLNRKIRLRSSSTVSFQLTG